MAGQPQYGKFRADALETIVQNGVSRDVHPNTAIMLRFKGLVDGSKAKKAVEPKQEQKKATEKAEKSAPKKNTSKKSK
jgi:hypothetical protein